MDDPPIFVRIGDIYRAQGHPNATIIKLPRTVAKIQLGDTRRISWIEVFNFERGIRWRDGIKIRVSHGRGKRHRPYFQPAEVVEVHGFAQPTISKDLVEVPDDDEMTMTM